MAKRVLQIIGTAYRGTLEEQDDTVVWITHAMKGAGLETDVLLRGNAVNYPLTAQDASGLSFGGRKQTQPPQIASDLARLLGKGVTVYVVKDDLEKRGITMRELIGGLKLVGATDLPGIFGGYEQIWHW
jgi:intracellular sulfur oxidation DsrE/DsrF family protein